MVARYRPIGLFDESEDAGPTVNRRIRIGIADLCNGLQPLHKSADYLITPNYRLADTD